MAYSNNNHCPIPASNQNNIYIGRDCYLFSKHSFDASLAVGRLTRYEFDNVLDKLHEKVNNFRRYWWIVIWGVLAMAIVITVFVVCLVYFSGSETYDSYD